MARKPFIAGNWKMNTTPAEAKALAEAVVGQLKGFAAADVALCPPFVCLETVRGAVQGTPVLLGAQNIHWEASGAFTGEVSAAMLKAVGCQVAIVGHSERRQFFGETDESVRKRLGAALAAGLQAIVCVGETLTEREGGQTKAVVERQVRAALQGLEPAAAERLTVAYEPVWAIGTGKVATCAQAQEVHAQIRGLLAERFGGGAAGAIRIQYGGSVKPDNAKELLGQPDIDGALVGGASLKAGDFVAIVKAAG